LSGIGFLPGWAAEADQPSRRQVEVAMQAAGVDLELYPVPYGCNANASAGEYGIPTVVLGPRDVSRAHRPEERISIEELVSAARIYGTIVKMNPPVSS
jgi:acetylornithine deacetylase/succinyl-diaminopimelate desuccinylase-like protein